MTTEVLGNLSFTDNPVVGTVPVLLNAGGVPSILADVTANRPAAAVAGRVYIDTSTNLIYRDTGSAWSQLGGAITYTGTTNQIDVTGSILSISQDPVIPGTGSMTLPTGTTAQRPASPPTGAVRFNSTLGFAEKYTGAYWGPFGLVLQCVVGAIPASSGTGTIPYDSTVPLVTEGNQIWSVTFTPISATSRILIQYQISAASSSTAVMIIGTTFAGSTCLRSVATRSASASGQNMPLDQIIVHQPGSTAAITYSGRLGSSTAATTYCNQSSAVTLGGTMASQFIIMEIE